MNLDAYNDEQIKYMLSLRFADGLSVADADDYFEAKYNKCPGSATARRWKVKYDAGDYDFKIEPVLSKTKLDNEKNRENRQLKAQIKELTSINNRLEKQADIVNAMREDVGKIHTAFPQTAIEFQEGEERDNPSTMQVMIPDIHWNSGFTKNNFWALIKSENITATNYNAYNLEIATKRVISVFDRTISAAKSNRDIEKLVFLFLGDLNQGDIHDSVVYNCKSSMVASHELGILLGEQIMKAQEELPWLQIEAIFVSGNHGRVAEIQSKGPNPRMMNNNYDYNTGLTAQLLLKNQPRIEITLSDKELVLDEHYGRVFMYTHGHQIKGGNSIAKIPIFGLAKFSLHLQDQAQEFAETNINTVIMGHFHTFLHHASGKKNLIIAPSIMGPDIFASSKVFSGSPAASVFISSERYPNGFCHLLDIPTFVD